MLGSINKILLKIFGSRNERVVKSYMTMALRAGEFEETIKALDDTALRAKTDEFKAALSQGTRPEDILPEAFAVVRETARRTVEMRHFDVQLIGGQVIYEGKIAEMATGEGKTLVATLAAYLLHLTGHRVHIVTVNDYLAKRDAEWMRPVYEALGLQVGAIQADMDTSGDERRAQYACDITYGTNNEFGFDYLRDNMASSADGCVLRELNYAIIDEVDNILVDEARTPLIISGPVTKSNKEYEELKPRITKLANAQTKLIGKTIGEIESMVEDEERQYELGKKLLMVKHGSPKNKRLLKLLKEPGINKVISTVETEFLRDRKLHELDVDLYYTIDESGHSAEMTEKGRLLISGNDPEFFVVPDLAEEIGKIDKDESLDVEGKSKKKEEAHRAYADRSERIHSVSQLLRAYSLFERDVEYVVQDGQILIVDEFTGRILHGRRYSEGLHQALEAKEGVRVAGENQTLATITFQNFFKMYNKIAGMTGTAATEAGEFHDIYKLDVVQIPTNRPMVRQDHNDEIYKTQREKYNAVVDDIKEHVDRGSPCLVGTTSIEKSELLGKLLVRAGVKHEVLNAKLHEKEAHIVAQAGRAGAVTIATNMAGRGTDIALGGNFEELANNELLKNGEDPDDFSKEELRARFPDLSKEIEEEHKRVVEAGGLHIIGTERHESRRIDNQLRGRAGRQGDPGSSKFFLSLDDDLMRIFGSERIAGIMDRLGAEEGEVISHPLVNRAISNAQKRVEGRNFEIRKHLKEYDDVMNYQRTEIYALRQRFLKENNIKDEILDQMATCIEDTVFKYTADGKFPETWDLEGLYNDLQTICGITYRIAKEELENKTQNALFDDLMTEVKKRYAEKEERFGADAMRQFERGVFLMVVDNLWKDHLYEMDNLKGGVQFRAFGQKNPLYEYQKEGLKAFEELRSMIAKEVTSFLFRLEAVERKDRMGVDHSKTTHSDFDVYSSAGAPQQGEGQKRPLATNRSSSEGGKQQPVRVADKVGRNDPCPCGSGKKYKKCCGAQ